MAKTKKTKTETNSNFKTSNPEVDYSVKIIRPISVEQKTLLETIENNVITFVDGPAGTGKTLMAVYYGINQLLSDSVSSLVLSRPAIEAGGEKLGFLPGEVESKISVYLIPLFDALLQNISIEKLKELYQKNGSSRIRVLPLAYMRGISFTNSFVIVDESQNTTPQQMRMILTRVGENSKIVCTGDSTQSDIRSTINGHRDAIERFSEVANCGKGVGIIKLTEKSLFRHPIIELIEEVYRKK